MPPPSSSSPLTAQRSHHYIAPSQQNLSNMHSASTLVLSCVDFRLRDEVARFLTTKLNLQDDYDEIALPGASLAFVTHDKPHWCQTIDDVVNLLSALHNIKRVIFLDHMGCGAYKHLLGHTMQDPKTEKQAHINTFYLARQKMQQKWPHLLVETWLMELDGPITSYDSDTLQS